MATTTSASATGWGQRLRSQALPVVVILLATLAAWYALTVYLNAPGAIERVLEPKGPWTWRDLLALLATARGFTLARTDTTADAHTTMARAFIVFNVIQFHVVHSLSL